MQHIYVSKRYEIYYFVFMSSLFKYHVFSWKMLAGRWAMVLWRCIIFRLGHMFHTLSNEFVHLEFSYSFVICVMQIFKKLKELPETQRIS